jgi:hypothetical protein
MASPAEADAARRVLLYLRDAYSEETGSMDFSKLSSGAKLALVGGAVLVVATFLPWYGTEIFSINAWDSEFWAIFGCILGIAGAIVLLLPAFGQKGVTAGSFKTEQLAFLLGAAGFVFIAIRWLTENNFVKYGLYLGLIAAGVVAYGAFMEMKSKGQNIPGMKCQTDSVRPRDPKGSPVRVQSPRSARPFFPPKGSTPGQGLHQTTRPLDLLSPPKGEYPGGGGSTKRLPPLDLFSP